MNVDRSKTASQSSAARSKGDRGYSRMKRPRHTRSMILLIDNYDSFVHNLERYLRQLGQETLVVRNDVTSPAEVRRLSPAAIVLSPGPCTPSEAGCSLALVRQTAGHIPILGVCLGHQTVAAALGAQIVRAREPMHGRTSLIEHSGSGLLQGLASPLVVGRYHSLTIDEPTLPTTWEVTARANDGTIMAIAHRRWPVFGVQFHPESILTTGGYRMLANFLELSGIDRKAEVPTMDRSWPRVTPQAALPAGPVTF